MSRFTVQSTPIEGLALLQRHPLGDQRGYLERLYCSDELQALIGSRPIMQINHTRTAKAGTVRGMHFQYPPHAEMKFVSCLRGEIYDVAVDLRRNSPTFLQWHGERLSADNHRTLIIPEGFAHGFQAMTDDCELLYLHTAAFQSEAEAGLDARDQKLKIDWPIPIAERSARDQTHTPLANDFNGIVV